jgi:hypothetical protein
MLMIGETEVSNLNHVKFSLDTWQGTEEQLIFLLDNCEKALSLQNRKYGGCGWYVTWSHEGIKIDAHI